MRRMTLCLSRQLIYIGLFILLSVIRKGEGTQQSYDSEHTKRRDLGLTRPHGTLHRKVRSKSTREKKKKSDKGKSKRGPKAIVKSGKGKGGKGKGSSKGEHEEDIGRNVPSPTAQPTCLECDDGPFERRFSFLSVANNSESSARRVTNAGIVFLGLIFLWVTYWLHRSHKQRQEKQQNGNKVLQAEWSDERTETETNCDESEWTEYPCQRYGLHQLFPSEEI